MAAAGLTMPMGPGSTKKVTKFDSAEKLTVEIFIAGDGIHYPRKGQTVDVHYTAYVSTNMTIPA
jgi:FKBP-type peptidyl-prolyl cis-trans isomerase